MIAFKMEFDIDTVVQVKCIFFQQLNQNGRNEKAVTLPSKALSHESIAVRGRKIFWPHLTAYQLNIKMINSVLIPATC